MPRQVEPAVAEKQREALGAWSGFLGALNDVQRRVLQKYTIIDGTGAPTIALFNSPQGGLGVAQTKVELEPVQQLIRADSTPDSKWTDWAFYQAGGGDQGKKGSLEALETVKRRFIDERTKGFPHPVTREYVSPISREQALAKWERNVDEVREIVEVGDEEAVAKLHCFGYYRKWPGGPEHNYENTVNALTEFLKVYERGPQMNKEIAREGQELLALEPDQIKTPREMEQATQKITRYFGSKKAREDIRTAEWKGKKTIYDDDVITAIAPLTYAAAVRYGFDEWAWAKREGFERALQTGDNFSDEWLKATQRGNVYVYLQFNVPVPGWIVRTSNQFERRRLTNLALQINREHLHALRPENITIYDEENNDERTLADIRQMILNEPTRQPEEEVGPILRGGPVYKTQKEAEEIVRHLDTAMNEVIQWAAHFDPKQIKSKAVSL